MRRRLALLVGAVFLLPTMAAAQEDGPLVFRHLIGDWRVEITGLGPDGEEATRRGTETCRWTAGHNAVVCEATFDAFGITLEETTLYSAQAATGDLGRTTVNSQGLAITAHCRSPQPNLLLCSAKVPTGDAERSTHLRDETRLTPTRQTTEWQASRDNRKTWTDVGRGQKVRIGE